MLDPISIGNFDPTKFKPVVLVDARALHDFLDTFELVFGDTDWPCTSGVLRDEGLKYMIDPNGTFLEPGVPDESNNWWNRGALLASYRRLKTALGWKSHYELSI